MILKFILQNTKNFYLKKEENVAERVTCAFNKKTLKTSKRKKAQINYKIWLK